MPEDIEHIKKLLVSIYSKVSKIAPSIESLDTKLDRIADNELLVTNTAVISKRILDELKKLNPTIANIAEDAAHAATGPERIELLRSLHMIQLEPRPLPTSIVPKISKP